MEFNFFWNWWSIPYWVSFFTSLIVTILLVAKKREGAVRLFIVVTFLVTINTLVSSLAACALDPNLWLIFIAMTVITGPLAISIIFHYSFVLLKQGTIFERKKVLGIYLGPLVLISLILINPRVLWGEVVFITDLTNYGRYGTTDPSIRIPYLWTFYNLYQALFLVLAAINFIRLFRRTVDLERQQAAYFILASLVPAIALTITSFFEYIGFETKLEPSTVSIAIAMLIITVGIFKAQLFDIELIISKSVKYTLLNIGLAWVFMGSREVMFPLVTSLFSGNQVATLLAGFVVITLFVPLKSVTSTFTTKLFPPSSITENLELYRRQLELLFEDGRITEKEGKILIMIRSFLEISADDAKRLEQEVLGTHEENEMRPQLD